MVVVEVVVVLYLTKLLNVRCTLLCVSVKVDTLEVFTHTCTHAQTQVHTFVRYIG